MLLKSLLGALVFYGAITLDEHMLVPLGTVLTVSGGVWYLGRKLQALDDRLDNGDERFKRMEESMKSRDETLSRMEHSIARLPCFDHIECQEDKIKKPKRSID